MERREFIISFGALLPVAVWPLKQGTAPREADVKERNFPCNGAGRWYPASSDELKETVNRFLSEAKSASGHPLAVIAPHAGFVYSGSGAGESYKTLKGKAVSRVIILGPSHYSAFKGISVLSGYSGYQTPLGTVRINQSAVAALLAEKHFTYLAEAHKPEHSVENQIPFIQSALPDAEIIPCVVGHLSEEEALEAGSTLRHLLDGKTVFAVSSDFAHYGSSFGFTPFKTDIRKNLEKLDGTAIDKILTDDAKGFSDYVEQTGDTICGREAITVMLHAIKGLAKGRLLKYYTSADGTSDFSHTVCYASIVMEKS